MSSNCRVAGHCGHWHSAWWAEYDPVCCWCGDIHPKPTSAPEITMAEERVSRCSDHLIEADVDPADQHDMGWCTECFRSVSIRPRHIATKTGGPDA